MTTAKPAKPFPDFPMGWHRSQYWVKRILGKLYYFGDRGDRSGKSALIDFNKRSPYLFAGQNPDDFLGDGYTLKNLCNDFIAYKAGEVEDGNLNERTLTDYRTICRTLLASVGSGRNIEAIGPDDFEKLLKDYRVDKAPATINNFVGCIKVVFNFAVKTNKLPSPNYGLRFKTVSPKAIRKHRKSKPTKLFSPAELQQVLDKADVQMKAAIMLGINCGFGNADIGRITFADIDLETGWHNYGRGKTGVERRCPLWPETVKAINDWLAVRDSDTDLVFIQNSGESWHRSDRPSYALANRFGKLGARAGLSFYCLRHSFETIGGDTKDQIAVDSIMGHAPDANDMSAVYREAIADKRLLDVSNFVRKHYMSGK